MKSRREITFSETASINLFECLVISGAPATGFLHAASFRDVGALQLSLQLLRDMWTRVNWLYIPKMDLESLHSMECKTAGSHVTDIPLCIAVDTRKLARYYVYLLFRYCVSAMEHGSLGDRSHKSPTLLLTDIPTPWLQTVASTNYPSAPPMFTEIHQEQQQQQQQQHQQQYQQQYHQQHQQQYQQQYQQQHQEQQHQQQHQHQQPSEMTQMNTGQQEQVSFYATHHAPQDRAVQGDRGPQHSHQLHDVADVSQRRMHNQMNNNRQQQQQQQLHRQPQQQPHQPHQQQQQPTSRVLYPQLPYSQQPSMAEKRAQATKRRVMGPFHSSAESEED